MSGPERFDAEAESLENDLASGNISVSEYNEQMRDLQREYTEAEADAMERAMEEVRENWR